MSLLPVGYQCLPDPLFALRRSAVTYQLALERRRAAVRECRSATFANYWFNREQYMKDAVAMGLDEHITWTGMVDDPFGEGVFHAADVVCQFSRWEEVFGWMIAEAMAHGKPVVATRVGGIPELVTDGISGHLVDRGDTTAMSDRILQLLGDPQLRRQMGEAGRETVSCKFDLRSNVAQLISSYGVS